MLQKFNSFNEEKTFTINIYIFKTKSGISYTSDNKVFHEYMNKDGYDYQGCIRSTPGGTLTEEGPHISSI
jgi:hypothetical protein